VQGGLSTRLPSWPRSVQPPLFPLARGPASARRRQRAGASRQRGRGGERARCVASTRPPTLLAPLKKKPLRCRTDATTPAPMTRMQPSHSPSPSSTKAPVTSLGASESHSAAARPRLRPHQVARRLPYLISRSPPLRKGLHRTIDKQGQVARRLLLWNLAGAVSHQASEEVLALILQIQVHLAAAGGNPSPKIRPEPTFPKHTRYPEHGMASYQSRPLCRHCRLTTACLVREIWKFSYYSTFVFIW